MERHGRIFRRAPETQQIATTSPTLAGSLLIPPGCGPTMPKHCAGARAPNFSPEVKSPLTQLNVPVETGTGFKKSGYQLVGVKLLAVKRLLW